MSLAVIVLAAGKGTRMNSDIPKVLHRLQNRPLIRFVVENAFSLNPKKTLIVAGYKSGELKNELSDINVDFLIQQEQLGTGHAVLCARETLANFNGSILILSGDVPTIDKSILDDFYKTHAKSNAHISFISSVNPEPHGYGRVVRDSSGEIVGVVEEKDATEKQKRIKEINSGIYIVSSEVLWEGLCNLNTDNNQNEYYLPGIIEYGVKNGLKITAFEVEDYKKTAGVNTRYELSLLEAFMKNEINSMHIENGVNIEDPETTFISEGVKIGKDSVIRPNTYIYGDTTIGRNSVIGPSVYIEDSKVGNNVVVRFSSYLTGCTVEDGVVMGPFCHLRPETYIHKNSKIGNFVEIKKSIIGEGSKVPHLSYVGDATVGENVNIGAGTITCNYDGVNKNRTVIEDNVFIGSDTMLVAPVKIGKNSTTAAGSTITKDVEPGSLAIERSNQKEIKGWNERKKKKREST